MTRKGERKEKNTMEPRRLVCAVKLSSGFRLENEPVAIIETEVANIGACAGYPICRDSTMKRYSMALDVK